MTALRIARLQRRFGLTHRQAVLVAAMIWGASDD